MLKYLVALFFITSLHSADLTLLEKLQQAEKGDYVVISQSRQYTLLHIQTLTNNRIYLEEVSIPEAHYHANSFKEWLLQNAPGHTSWILYTLDKTNGQILKAYSWTIEGFFQPSQQFFTTLLTLPFSKMAPSQRHKVGHTPTDGHDRRRTWQPPITLNGKKLKDITCDAFLCTWPKDGSELSGKTLEIYFPNNLENAPSYFPYWLSIRGTAGLAKLRLIDAGKNMQSPKDCNTRKDR